VSGVLHAAVEMAMRAVYDPCSVASRAPLDVFEMGLIRSWSVADDGTVDITLSPTSPSCVLIGSITQGIEQRVGDVPGVSDVVVTVDTDTFWTPELMSEQGREKLEIARERSRAGAPVRPRQWQEAGAAVS
jgi:metal-sulfur cluster biosynthetic enzyme